MSSVVAAFLVHQAEATARSAREAKGVVVSAVGQHGQSVEGTASVTSMTLRVAKSVERLTEQVDKLTKVLDKRVASGSSGGHASHGGGGSGGGGLLETLLGGAGGGAAAFGVTKWLGKLRGIKWLNAIKGAGGLLGSGGKALGRIGPLVERLGGLGNLARFGGKFLGPIGTALGLLEIGSDVVAKRKTSTLGAAITMGASGAAIGSIVPGVGTLTGGIAGSIIGALSAWGYNNSGVLAAATGAASRAYDTVARHATDAWASVKNTAQHAYASVTSNLSDLYDAASDYLRDKRAEFGKWLDKQGRTMQEWLNVVYDELSSYSFLSRVRDIAVSWATRLKNLVGTLLSSLVSGGRAAMDAVGGATSSAWEKTKEVARSAGEKLGLVTPKFDAQPTFKYPDARGIGEKSRSGEIGATIGANVPPITSGREAFGLSGINPQAVGRGAEGGQAAIAPAGLGPSMIGQGAMNLEAQRVPSAKGGVFGAGRYTSSVFNNPDDARAYLRSVASIGSSSSIMRRHGYDSIGNMNSEMALKMATALHKYNAYASENGLPKATLNSGARFPFAGMPGGFARKDKSMHAGGFGGDVGFRGRMENYGRNIETFAEFAKREGLFWGRSIYGPHESHHFNLMPRSRNPFVGQYDARGNPLRPNQLRDYTYSGYTTRDAIGRDVAAPDKPVPEPRTARPPAMLGLGLTGPMQPEAPPEPPPVAAKPSEASAQASSPTTAASGTPASPALDVATTPAAAASASPTASPSATSSSRPAEPDVEPSTPATLAPSSEPGEVEAPIKSTGGSGSVRHSRANIDDIPSINPDVNLSVMAQSDEI